MNANANPNGKTSGTKNGKKSGKKSGGAGKWALLGGCGCLLVVAGCAGFVGLIFTGVRTMMMHSDSYEVAMQALSDSEAAEGAVGAPFEPGWFFSGSVSTNNGRETADYSFPVKGPNGKGKVFVRGECDRGECDLRTLELETGGERIDLLE